MQNFYFNMPVFCWSLRILHSWLWQAVCVLVNANREQSCCHVGKIIYCICYMTSVRPHHTVCVTWLLSRLTLDQLLVSYTMCSVQPSHYTTTVCRSVINFKTVLPHSVVQINGLNILARLLFFLQHCRTSLRGLPAESCLIEKLLTPVNCHFKACSIYLKPLDLEGDHDMHIY